MVDEACQAHAWCSLVDTAQKAARKSALAVRLQCRARGKIDGLMVSQHGPVAQMPSGKIQRSGSKYSLLIDVRLSMMSAVSLPPVVASLAQAFQ